MAQPDTDIPDIEEPPAREEDMDDGVKEEGEVPNAGPEVPPFSPTPKVVVGDQEIRDQIIRRLKMHEEEMLDLELDLWEMTVRSAVSQEIVDELQKKQALIYSYVVMYRNTFGES